jgi:hypothetical protein
VRSIVATIATLLAVGAVLPAPSAVAEPTECNDAFCTPGIAPGAVLGADCDNSTYFVFATTSWGRLVFCGSPRRYAPRYFRSPPMAGVKDENSSCLNFDNYVAQAPDGLFLTCSVLNGASVWVRGDT